MRYWIYYKPKRSWWRGWGRPWQHWAKFSSKYGAEVRAAQLRVRHRHLKFKIKKAPGVL